MLSKLLSAGLAAFCGQIPPENTSLFIPIKIVEQTLHLSDEEQWQVCETLRNVINLVISAQEGLGNSAVRKSVNSGNLGRKKRGNVYLFQISGAHGVIHGLFISILIFWLSILFPGRLDVFFDF